MMVLIPKTGTTQPTQFVLFYKETRQTLGTSQNMDSRFHKTVFLIQYEHMKGSFIPSVKGQTKRTNTTIHSILPDTTTSSTTGATRIHTITYYNTTE